MGFPADSVVKNLPANAGDLGLIPRSGRSPGRGNDNPLQNSCLENSMDRVAWWATVSVQFSCSVTSDCATPWTAACQTSLSITNSQSLIKLMSIELVMPSNHLILCHPLLLLPSIFPSIRFFSNELVLHIMWPKLLELQLQQSVHPMNIQD